MKVSVIIPAYNEEKYIKRCLDSVTSQTFTDLEIIVVNDGSTDGTLSIAGSCSDSDKRIKIITTEQGGLSRARNTGIDASSGDLLFFVDSDDLIRNDCIEILVKDLLDTGADLVVASYCEGDGSRPFADRRMPRTSEVVSGRDKYRKLFDLHKNETIIAWTKLYRRSLFSGIRFPEGKCHEDEYVAHHILERAEKVVYEPEILYYYFKKPGSITTSAFSFKRLDAIPAIKDRIAFFEKMGDSELTLCAYTDFLKRVQYYYYGVRYNYPEKKDIYETIFEDYRSVYEKAKEGLSVVQRLRFKLFICFPVLNYHLRTLFKAKDIKT